MSNTPENDGALSRRSASRLLDEVCDSFEAEWSKGQRPQFEDYLLRVDEGHRAQLLTELIQSDIELRLKNGETPSEEDYSDLLPNHPDAVANALRRAFPPNSDDSSTNDTRQAESLNKPRQSVTKVNQRALGEYLDVVRQQESDNTLSHNLSARERTRSDSELIRQSFKDYEVLEVLGQGGMGVVYKARHRRMQRIVALKTLAPAITEDKQAVRRFQREVEAAARLNHPNIITAHDAGEENGVHFLVMEYVDGTDLSKLVRESGPLPVDRAVNYILQAAGGLQFAHENNIVHRDVKPSNLLLDGDDQVKILDMGLARFNVSAFESADSNADLTNTGVVMGTVDYMSPEQALDAHEADQRSDIYSLGCTLYYLLAGEPVYQAETVMKKLLAHRERAIPSVCAKRPDVSGEVDAVLQRMLAKDKKNRYQSIDQVISALQQCDLSNHAGDTMVRQPHGEGQTTIRHDRDTDLRETEQTDAANANRRQPPSNIQRRLVVGIGLLFVLAFGVIWWINRDDRSIAPSNGPPMAIAPFNAEQAKQHQEEWANHLGVDVEIENSIGMKLTLIPPGTFQMGSSKKQLDRFKAYKKGGDYWLGRIYSEYPQRKTTISKPFFIGTFEVTQKQFEQVMGYNPSQFRKGKTVLPSDIADTDSFPVESITWPETMRFCDKLSLLPAEKAAGRTYRLPTEAEWEYACRAGTTTLYPLGDMLSTEQANIEDTETPFNPIGQKSGLKRTTAVGSYAPNAFGLYDMIGNVWEMCSDYSHSSYDPNQTIDPTGGPETAMRISRGGAWNHSANRCRSAWRGADSPNRPWASLGFRVVCIISKRQK